ncbi:MAG TPA: MarR family transcriptional regulator [Gaiellaceae bacterium]|nr:MarR family transcriptional regulator [Gaiellaceae bacterium]
MPKVSTDEFIAAAEFRSALRSFQRLAEHAARRVGLTPQRYLLLLMIRGAADGSASSTVTELSERLQLAQSTVTELVGRAEEAGLVEREPSLTDARVAHLRVTREGERRLSRIVEELSTERDDLQLAFEKIGHPV